jgi:hypothetical protein
LNRNKEEHERKGRIRASKQLPVMMGKPKKSKKRPNREMNCVLSFTEHRRRENQRLPTSLTESLNESPGSSKLMSQNSFLYEDIIPRMDIAVHFIGSLNRQIESLR